MKNITSILKRALRKSAMSLQEDRRLLQEQNSGGDYGQQITNTIDQNGQCYTPIVKKCSVLTTGQPSPDTNCRYYPLRCLKDPQGNPYQIGECFSWNDNDFIECVVGYTNFLKPTLARIRHTCPACSNDTDGDGHFDCIDCSDETFTSNIPGCLNCPNCSNYGGNLFPNPVNLDDGSCLGCTDPNFANYEPNADIDDGSCMNPPVIPNFDCINGDCEENIDGTGIHATLNDCLISEECNRYECLTTQDPGALEEQALPEPTISNCVKCDAGRYNVVDETWDPLCQYFDKQDCDAECTPIEPPVDPCEDFQLGIFQGTNPCCELCGTTGQGANQIWNTSTYVGPGTHPNDPQCWYTCQCCVDIPVGPGNFGKDIECMQCGSDGAPIANMFPGPLCPTGWTPSQQFNPSSCKKSALDPLEMEPKMIEPTKDVRDMEVPLNEGLQLKGELLNKSRMTELANIKKK